MQIVTTHICSEWCIYHTICTRRQTMRAFEVCLCLCLSFRVCALLSRAFDAYYSHVRRLIRSARPDISDSCVGFRVQTWGARYCTWMCIAIANRWYCPTFTTAHICQHLSIWYGSVCFFVVIGWLYYTLWYGWSFWRLYNFALMNMNDRCWLSVASWSAGVIQMFYKLGAIRLKCLETEWQFQCENTNKPTY